MKSYILPWREPLEVASAYKQEPLVLLYSGVQAGYSGNASLLACGLIRDSESITQLAAQLSAGLAPFTNAWFGYLGYALPTALNAGPEAAPSFIDLPTLWMGQFERIFHFDHATRILTCWADAPPAFSPITCSAALPSVIELTSNMQKAEYLAHVQSIVEDIHAGALYQVNLTRKFFGRFSETPDTLTLFCRLCAVSPAPYSAYIRLPSGQAILSSSPERFLKIEPNGHITTRPIKGSAGRVSDAIADKKIAHTLSHSPKDRAENLMITDLMRNDLSRSCIPGSVTVDRLFEVTTHATVHHLSSTISGQRQPESTTLDVITACFPPGSMTGAPKHAAMQRIHSAEPQARGVYSGAMGWFGGDGSCDLSVIIRTLIVDGDRFEFQVGGGIVADSDPENEWTETLIKTRGIARTLGIEEAQLAAL